MRVGRLGERGHPMNQIESSGRVMADAAEFLGALFKGVPGHIEVRPMVDRDTGENRAPGDMRDTDRRWWGSWEDLAAHVPQYAEWGRRNRRAIFFGVLPRVSGKGSAADVMPGRVVWADIDFKSFRAGEDEARARLTGFPISPSIVVQSAHGLHAYWLLTEVIGPRFLSDLSRRVSEALGADRTHNPDRLLRLPGSWNCKRDPERQVVVELMNPDHRITPLELAEAVPSGHEHETPSAELPGDVVVELRAGKRVTVAELQQGEPCKHKIKCPFQADASPGSAFIRITDAGGALIVCSSARHGHNVKDGTRKWYRPRAGVKRSTRPKAGAGLPSGADPEVWRSLDTTRQGSVRASLRNIRAVLSGDVRWAGRVHHNELDGRTYLDGKPLTDSAITDARRWLDEHYRLRVPKGEFADELDAWAWHHRRHPVRARLQSLTWDGVTRCGELLTTYFGAEDTPLAREIGMRWLVSAVARVFQPGVKVDTVLILVGKQGALKSTAFATLAMCEDWFSDTAIDFGRGNDCYEKIRGVWIYELAELSSVRRRDVESVKAFITSRRDRFREAYARCVTENPRQCVFVGTTNEPEFLADGTGSRRFWPVRIGSINLAALESDVEQLWAEAVTRYHSGERWWLEGAYYVECPDTGAVSQVTFDQALRDASAGFQSCDPWTHQLEVWVMQRPEPFTVAEALSGAVRKDAAALTRMDEMRAVGILSAMGCTKVRKLRNGIRQRLWVAPAELK